MFIGNRDWLGIKDPEAQKVDLVSSSPAVGAQVFFSRSRNSLDRFPLLGYKLDSWRFKAATSIVVASDFVPLVVLGGLVVATETGMIIPLGFTEA